MTDDDPQDSPLTRHVLYTNDVSRVLACFVQGLLTVARPERVRAAVEGILFNWDERVKAARAMADLVAKDRGEPSGWREPSEEN